MEAKEKKYLRGKMVTVLDGLILPTVRIIMMVIIMMMMIVAVDYVDLWLVGRGVDEVEWNGRRTR